MSAAADATGGRRPRGRWFTVVVAVGLVAGLVAALALVLRVPAPTDPLHLDVLGAVDGAPATEVRRCTLAPHDDLPEEVREVHPPGTWVTSAVVNGCPTAFDQQEVRYVGEVIGDLLPRRDGSWALVNDDAYALDVGPLTGHRDHQGVNTGLAVWLPEELAGRVSQLGRPGVRGDVVEVVGTILRDDPHDGGGLTLRADELRVVWSGSPVTEPLHVPTLVLAVLASGSAMLAWLGRRWASRSGPPHHPWQHPASRTR